MGQNKKKNGNKNKVFRIIMLIAIFIYFALRAIPNIISFSTKTVFPEREVIGDNYNTNAIIIRNEELYKSAGRGNVKYSAKEAERVPSGKHIAQLKLSGNASTHDQKLQELNKKIEILTEAKGEIDKEDKTSPEKTQDNINNILKEIQKNLQNGNYEEAEVLKEKLSIYEGNKDDIAGGKVLIDESLQKLQSEKAKITEEINKNTIDYYAKDAGIVSFKVDGYEEVYKYSDRSKYKFEDLKEKPIKKNLLDNKVSENNEPIFKIISNYEWFMIIDGTKLKDVDEFKEGNNIRIGSKDKEIVGRIENIHKTKENITILCRFNTDFEEFYDQRFVNIDVIRYKYDGFKIPKKAIVEEDNQKGVFIRDISGITKFRPVKILYEKDESVYVSTGDEQNNIKIGVDDELVRTITKFDEILLNNPSIKEGMILK